MPVITLTIINMKQFYKASENVTGLYKLILNYVMKHGILIVIL